MKIAFIGAGKVSAALGLYFKNNGFEIGGYYSIGGASAGKAAQLTSSTHYSSLERLINDNQLIWIATPDDQIEKVVQQISHLEITGKTDKLILHVSGVYSLSILDPLKVTGYQTGSAHPLLAFGDPVVTQQTLHGAWFAVEKGEEDNGRLNLLLESCGNPTFTVTPGRKPLYHAAACLLSNYLVTLMDASYRIFERSGLPADNVREATCPLFERVVRSTRRSRRGAYRSSSGHRHRRLHLRVASICPKCLHSIRCWGKRPCGCRATIHWKRYLKSDE